MLRVEKINGGTEYRVYVKVDGEDVNFHYCVDAHGFRHVSYRDQIINGLIGVMASEFRGDLLNKFRRDLEYIFNRYGELDNTARPVYNTTGTEVREYAQAIGINLDRWLLNHILPVPNFTQEYPAFSFKKQKDTPARKAWALVRKTVGKKLYRDLQKKGYFEVEGKRGTFRFHKNKQGGVTFIEKRQYGNRVVPVEFDLCIQSQAGDLPEGDVIVSRYLNWKADEEEFLQTANFCNCKTPDEAHIRSVRR